MSKAYVESVSDRVKVGCTASGLKTVLQIDDRVYEFDPFEAQATGEMLMKYGKVAEREQRGQQ